MTNRDPSKIEGYFALGLANDPNTVIEALETFMLGYARLGSPQHRAMDRILANVEPLHRATLKLEHKGTEEARQFEIISVLAEDWVLGETPYDEDF